MTFVTVLSLYLYQQQYLNELYLNSYSIYFPASFISKITFPEWQLNQFNNMQFYTVGAHSRVPPQTCHCWWLSWAAMCVSGLFSAPGSWGGLALWDGHRSDLRLRRSPLPHFVTWLSCLSPQSCQPVPTLPPVRLCQLEQLHFRCFVKAGIPPLPLQLCFLDLWNPAKVNEDDMNMYILALFFRAE